MIKVLIVDDEVMVRVLLSKLVDWKEFDMEIVALAEDGLQALQTVQEREIDLVVADIRMPGLDGIGFIKKIRELGYGTKVIFVSGHKQFEYAQSGIQFGVDDYILKPIKKDKLSAALEKIKEKIEEEQKGNTNIKRIEDELQSSRKMLRNGLVKRLLDEEITGSRPEDLLGINQQYMCSFSEGEFLGGVFRIDVEGLSGGLTPELKMSDGICAEFEKTVGPFCYELITEIKGRTVILLLNYGKQREQAVYEALKLAFKNSAAFIDRFNDLIFTLGVGKPQDEPKLFKRSYLQAVECVKSRIVKGLGKIIFYTDHFEHYVNMEELFPLGKQRQFENAVEIQDQNQCIKLAKEIMEPVFLKENPDYIEIRAVMQVALEIFWRGMQQAGECEEECRQASCHFDDCNSIDLLLKELLKLFRECISCMKEKNGSENPFVVAAKNYIKENFGNKITLMDIATVIHLNPVYFSILFKRETGAGFMDYLTEYRIEQAKGYLRNNQYSVAQIAEMVGYGDSRHFSKMFKQVVGIPPVEYRKNKMRSKK